jgi:hypothetical protein
MKRGRESRINMRNSNKVIQRQRSREREKIYE